MRYRIAALGVGALAMAACRDAPTAQTASSATTSDAASRTFLETPPPPAQRRLGVATYNLFLGANLKPIYEATSQYQLLLEAANAWNHVQATDFRIRAGAIARQIGGKHPHLVALEEVSLWETASALAPTVFTTRYDYLQLLLDSLSAQGTPYRTAIVNPNFTAVLPVALDLSLFGRYTQRNAIIVRDDLDDDEFHVTNANSTTFAPENQLIVNVGGQPLNTQRGFASIDVRFRGKWLRFVATHPEAFDTPKRKAQAAELAAALALSPYDVVLAGDLNSWRDSTADSWQILTGAGFVDVWTETMPGVIDNTASFGDDLDWPLDSLNHTVDYVLRTDRGTLQGVLGESEILGDEVADKSPNGWWPSDHAGVFVTVKIVKE